MYFLNAIPSSSGRRTTIFVFRCSKNCSRPPVNSDSIKITSHPEVFSRQANKIRNQPRNKEAMITWIRASFVNSVIKVFRVSTPRWHSRGIVRWLGIVPRRIRPLPALIPALTSPLIIPISPRIVQIVAVVLLLQLSTKQLLVCLR